MKRGMNSTEMQKNNRLLVFRTLKEEGSMTRTELSVMLNLQKATITNIINEFYDMGIIAVDGDMAAGRRGEKICLKLDDIYIMALGITRKDFQIEMFTLQGIQAKHIRYHFKKNENIFAAVELMKRQAAQMLDEFGRKKVIGICLAVPGLFINRPEKNEEIFMVSEFEELNQMNIHKEIEEALGVPVMIKHDAKLSAYAEWKSTQEAKINERFSLAVIRSRGYGIGVGCVINGNIVNGQLGLAGEAGYMGINYNAPQGNQDNEGSFEHCAGTESAMRYVRERMFEFPDTCLREDSSYYDVLEAYKNGDALAAWAIYKIAWMLGYGIANIIYMVNPDSIIIGSDYPDTKDFILKVRESIRRFVPPYVEECVNIRYSSLSEDSFLLGGYYYVLETLNNRGTIFDLIRRAKGSIE